MARYSARDEPAWHSLYLAEFEADSADDDELIATKPGTPWKQLFINRSAIESSWRWGIEFCLIHRRLSPRNGRFAERSHLAATTCLFRDFHRPTPLRDVVDMAMLHAQHCLAVAFREDLVIARLPDLATVRGWSLPGVVKAQDCIAGESCSD